MELANGCFIKAFVRRGCKIFYGQYVPGQVEPLPSSVQREYNVSCTLLVKKLDDPQLYGPHIICAYIEGIYCCNVVSSRNIIDNPLHDFRNGKIVFTFEILANKIYDHLDNDNIDKAVHYMYTGELLTPTYEQIRMCHYNLYPVIYNDSFCSNISLYMYLLNMLVPDIKKMVINLILCIDNWHNLDICV